MPDALDSTAGATTTGTATRRPTIEDAIRLATAAHRGQVDKAGQPYIFHPLRLMSTMASAAAQMVAVFHDVVEDTTVTLEDLQQAGYPEAVVTAVALLTHDPEVEYLEYVGRIKANDLARQVKLADLQDNMRLERIKAPTPKDHARLERYRAAVAMLTA